MWGWAASGSLGPAALLEVSLDGNPLQWFSSSWRSRSWQENAVWTQAPAIPPEPARELSTEAPSHPRFKTPFRSCILESSTLLGEQTTAAMCLCSAKPRWPFSPLALWSPEGTDGLGCFWLPGPCCFAGGLLSLKPTPKVFSFVENQELAGKCLLGAAAAIPPRPAREISTEAPCHP